MTTLLTHAILRVVDREGTAWAVVGHDLSVEVAVVTAVTASGYRLVFDDNLPVYTLINQSSPPIAATGNSVSMVRG